ncbi:MAG TPA: outer membrane beta-barrel protein [Vicinamibacterales bacterium]|nr:outer membrane beta-barrel protein [Vicinamibacterales bacterium]
MTPTRLLVLLFVLLASPALAQQVPTESDDPVADAPIRLGVVGVRPRLGITDFGVDTNVFNSQTNKQRDVTFTIRPGTQLFLRTGRGLLTVDGGIDLVYFREFATERSLNSNVNAQYEFRLNRLRPFLGVSTLNTRERPGYEIDVRARRYETGFRGGADFRVASKSLVRAEIRRLKSSFDGDAVFGGRPLNQALSRDLIAIDLGWRQRLTALTTWVTRLSVEQERFEFENLRDSNTFRASTGFELGRFALIRGSAFVGYRRLKGTDESAIPAFSGITSDVNVSYTAPSQTRLSLEADRDLQYSYDLLTPYYIQTGWTATVTQRVVGRWDVQATGGRDRLAYQGIIDAIDRRDFVGRWGGGAGYNAGEQFRIGFNVQSFYRSSELPGREYGGVRAGFSVTYGY